MNKDRRTVASEGRRGRGSARRLGGSAAAAGRPYPSAVAREEYMGVAFGRDTVEPPERRLECAVAFNSAQMVTTRGWLRSRPLEAAAQSAAVIRFPRLWSTQRGRYCRFKAPGAGVYGVVRARPSF